MEMKTMKRIVAITASALCASATLVPAGAAAQAADAWKYDGIIYLYLPTISGKTNFQGPPAGTGGSGSNSDVGVDAEKILDSLKFAFMGTLEASNGRWGALTDVIYMDVGSSKSGTRDLTVGGAELPAGVNGNAHYDLKGLAWTLGGTWRMVSKPDSTMDLLAGARMLDITQKLEWEFTGNLGPIPTPGRAGNREVKAKNWDAIVGVKGRVAVGDGGKWYVPYYLDVGTGDSDLTWQGVVGLGYEFKWGGLVATWRYLDYKMKSGKAVENLNFNGPMVGAVFHW
jgi:hypothetical protein